MFSIHTNPVAFSPRKTDKMISQLPQSETKPPPQKRLRQSDPEFHEFAVKTEISDFFISGQERPFGDPFTKITIKLSKEFLFSRNSAKREMPYLLRSRHEILPRFGAFSKRSGRKTAQRTEMIF